MGKEKNPSSPGNFQSKKNNDLIHVAELIKKTDGRVSLINVFQMSLIEGSLISNNEYFFWMVAILIALQ